MRHPRRFTDEFKRQIVGLHDAGVDLTRRVASKGRVRDIMAPVTKPRS